ncbi:copper chaperone PCu(A)C [Streptomyces sp. JJ36]|uniref:copper chaperone PCu(A)C n=1 Tax=Streptomyces sp. JJ36 TaxID=2736645 RepID=UPI001F3C0A7E|nr:copper chaperone PCu(A)C [Streptomyces sp. JJ36]MCF6522126.1 copper chaperone PCu(A)C [Streptomyces sp. JJ36]
MTHAPRRRTALVCSLALAGALALGACSTGGDGAEGGKERKAASADRATGPELRISGAYVPQPVMQDMAAGFLTVRNSGGRDDALTRVTSDLAARVELHETTDRQMRQVASFPVPAGGALRLSRGGNHLMLLDLKRKPVRGDTVTLTLHFAHHKPLTVPVPVEATHHDPGAASGDGRDSGGDHQSGSHHQ